MCERALGLSQKNNLQVPENKQYFTPDKRVAMIFKNNRMKGSEISRFLTPHLSELGCYCWKCYKKSSCAGAPYTYACRVNLENTSYQTPTRQLPVLPYNEEMEMKEFGDDSAHCAVLLNQAARARDIEVEKVEEQEESARTLSEHLDTAEVPVRLTSAQDLEHDSRSLEQQMVLKLFASSQVI